MTTETTQVSDSMFGGNASTEATEEDESADGKISQSGCNIVLANRLVETQFAKKDFQTYIKVCAYLPFSQCHIVHSL